MQPPALVVIMARSMSPGVHIAVPFVAIESVGELTQHLLVAFGRRFAPQREVRVKTQAHLAAVAKASAGHAQIARAQITAASFCDGNFRFAAIEFQIQGNVAFDQLFLQRDSRRGD